jgi:hypothetical protein
MELGKVFSVSSDPKAGIRKPRERGREPLGSKIPIETVPPWRPGSAGCVNLWERMNHQPEGIRGFKEWKKVLKPGRVSARERSGWPQKMD